MKAEKGKAGWRRVLIRVTAGVMAVIMVSSVLLYNRTDVTVDPRREENKAARLAARQLLADNDYVNASRLERMTAFTRNLLGVRNSSGSYQRAAEIEIAQGNYQEAISLTAKAIEMYEGSDDGEEAEMYFRLGYLHVMEGEYEEAMKWLNLGLELKDSPEARLIRAQVRLNLGEPDMRAALDDVSSYMESAENSGENLEDLINIYEAAGEYETAALMYTRLIEKDPQPDYYLHRAYCHIGIAQAQRNPDGMESATADRDAYERAGGKDTATADVMLGIGWMRIEDYDRAGQRFIAALNGGYADPESLYYYIVLCSYVSMNFRQAGTYGDQVIDRVSRGEGGTAAEMTLENTTGKMKVTLVEIDFPFLCRMTGESYIQIGNYSQAIQCLTMSLSRDPDMAEVRYLRGVCLMVEKRYQEAEEDFSRAIAGDRETENCHYSRAICRIKQEKAAAALEDLDWILIHGTDAEHFRDASEWKDQLLAGEFPAIDEEQLL